MWTEDEKKIIQSAIDHVDTARTFTRFAIIKMTELSHQRREIEKLNQILAELDSFRLSQQERLDADE